MAHPPEPAGGLPGSIMKNIVRLSALFAGILLWSCSPVPAAVATSTPVAPSSTPQPSATLPPTAQPTQTPTATATRPPLPAVKRVLIISMDGLRPDGLLRAEIPNISKWITGGASSFTAQTIMPSVTLPAHSSMLSGTCPSKHQITWNDYIPENGYIQVPTVFSVAHDAGLRTVMVVGKQKLVTIARPGTVDSFTVTDHDEDTVAAAVKQAEPGFGVMFVHLTLPDFAGHQDGWMSPLYIQVIGQDDTAIGTLMDGLQKEGMLDGTLIILTADHGGHDTTHGTDQAADMTIPWIVYGPGVLPAFAVPVPVSTTDTAATAVWALGLTLPAEWDGRPVVEAFGLSAEAAGVKPATADRCGS